MQLLRGNTKTEANIAVNYYADHNKQLELFNKEFKNIVYDGYIVWSLKKGFVFFEEVRNIETEYSKKVFTLDEHNYFPKEYFNYHKEMKTTRAKLHIDMQKGTSLLADFNMKRLKMTETGHLTFKTVKELNDYVQKDKHDWKKTRDGIRYWELRRHLRDWMKSLEAQIKIMNKVRKTKELPPITSHDLMKARCKVLGLEVPSVQTTFLEFLDERFRQIKLDYKSKSAYKGNIAEIRKGIEVRELKGHMDESFRSFRSRRVEHLEDMNKIFFNAPLRRFIRILREKLDEKNPRQYSESANEFPIEKLGVEDIPINIRDMFAINLVTRKLEIKISGVPKAARELDLSILSRVTIDRITEVNAMKIGRAKFFYFCYPMKAESIALVEEHVQDKVLMSFLSNGGFVYLNTHRKICSATAIDPDSNSFGFDGPYPITREEASDITFHDVTLAVLKGTAIKKFAWLPPARLGLNDHGAFLYEYKHSRARSSEFIAYKFVVHNKKDTETAEGSRRRVDHGANMVLREVEEYFTSELLKNFAKDA